MVSHWKDKVPYHMALLMNRLKTFGTVFLSSSIKLESS
jgi:hypothetical protein